jgi:hypothetical protein
MIKRLNQHKMLILSSFTLFRDGGITETYR